MLTNILHRWDDIRDLGVKQKVYPKFVDLHTSDVCNQRCHGCAYKGKHTGATMTEDRHYEAVRQFVVMGVEAFDFAGGGEPTMLPYLSDLMAYIDEMGCHYGLITNGSKLTNDLVDEVLNHGTYLRVSLEASTPWSFQNYKGVPATEFTRISDRLREVVQERNRRKSDLEISLKFSIGKSMRGPLHYQMMFNVAESIGVDRISVKPLRHEPEELSYDERYAEYALFMKARPASTPFKVVESILPYPFDKVPQCWLNPLHTVMDHNGDLYICCYFYDRNVENYKIGNIFTQNFDDFWFSEEHMKKISNIKREDCARVDCKFFNHHQAVSEASKRGAVYFL